MFYDHLSTRSWLNWVDEDDDEDEVGLKEKLETSKRLHRNKTRSTGSVGKGLNLLNPNLLPSLGLRTRKSARASNRRAPSGGVKCPSRWRLQPGLILWFPPDPRRRCSKFLNLNGRTAFCIPWYNLLIMASRARQRGAELSFAPQ